MSLYFFFLLISSMGIDKKANEMMICLSSGCIQKAAAVSIARSRGIDFWGKPNLRVLSSREGRDGEASWRGSSGCPANLVSHLPFSSSLLHFFFKLWGCIVCQALLVVNSYARAREVNRWVGHPGLNSVAALYLFVLCLICITITLCVYQRQGSLCYMLIIDDSRIVTGPWAPWG